MSNYLLDVKSEISQISWASKDEVIRCSLLVFVVVAVASAFFLVVDLASYKLVNFLLSVA